ncbi:MAG: plasmid recombination protein [Lachnospiraceae bacterium]
MAKVTKQEVTGIGARTISFVKGKGNLNHNNREFICKNVHEERVQWNRVYKRETLKEAYDYCFGNALAEYNYKQKRKDRIKQDYIHEIEHSGNKEKVFYENVVQIGKMEDTAVTDENGNLAEAAGQVIKVLDEYARTFQERNPNLYMFNCVLHLDEATPHLHIDYIPVAHGYKTGLGTRNSLTKAFQEMGFAKATGKRDNETMAWQRREREYLQYLCAGQGIEIETLGVKRDNYTLPEYKKAMEITNELQKQANEMQKQVKKDKVIIDKYNLEAEALKKIEQVLKEDENNIKGAAVPVKSFFGNGEYVKIKKNDWGHVLEAYKWAKSKEKLLEQYEETIIAKDNKISQLQIFKKNCISFISKLGLAEKFNEFISPKSVKKELKNKQEQVNRQKQYKLSYSQQEKHHKREQAEI